MRRLARQSVFIVLKLDNDFLDKGRSQMPIQFPHWTFGNFGFIKTGSFGENGHAIGAFLKRRKLLIDFIHRDDVCRGIGFFRK